MSGSTHKRKGDRLDLDRCDLLFMVIVRVNFQFFLLHTTSLTIGRFDFGGRGQDLNVDYGSRSSCRRPRLGQGGIDGRRIFV